MVRQLGLRSGVQVLDLGCGDGTTAIPGARLGARVKGIDIAENLVKAASMRAAQEKLVNCEFAQGDACDLKGVASNSFDLVLSVFGAMFAPRPLDVAREMVRVTRPGGKIVMGNWIPGDPTLVAQVLAISAKYTPAPPPDFVSPMLWGVEEQVIERFAQAGIRKESITMSRETFTFQAPFSPSVFLTRFRDYYGPTMNAFEAAGKSGKAEELQQALEQLFKACNTSHQPDYTLIPATYLKVVVQC